jgi:hypothetical protein
MEQLHILLDLPEHVLQRELTATLIPQLMQMKAMEQWFVRIISTMEQVNTHAIVAT